MSLQAMTCAFAVKGLSASEKLVLLALANYADREMKCFPSQGAIAEDTELSERTVWSAIKTLEERRIISKEARHRYDGSRTTDVFTLHFAVEIRPNVEEKPKDPPSQDLRAPPANFAPPLATIAPPLATVATLTTFEPVTGTYSEEDNSSSAEVADLDPDKRAWTDGVSLLKRAHRLSDDQARAFFGKLLSTNRIKARELLPAIGQCIANSTEDPRAYLTKAAQSISRRRDAGTDPPKQRRVSWV